MGGGVEEWSGWMRWRRWIWGGPWESFHGLSPLEVGKHVPSRWSKMSHWSFGFWSRKICIDHQRDEHEDLSNEDDHMDLRGKCLRLRRKFMKFHLFNWLSIQL